MRVGYKLAANSVQACAIPATVFDARDPHSVRERAPDYLAACERDPRKLRIAWSPTFGYATPEPEMRAIVATAVQAFAAMGCAVEEVAAPFGDDPADIWSAEFYAGVGRNLVSWVTYTYPFNLTGQPAASIPAGFTRTGLPVGLQIVARAYGEADLFAVAAAYEALCPWAQRRPAPMEQQPS